MSTPTQYAEAPLNRLANALGRSLRRPVRVHWDTNQVGGARAWIEVQDRGRDSEYVRAASLAIQIRGPTASYTVCSPSKQALQKKFTALAAALRELRAVALNGADHDVPDKTAPDTSGHPASPAEPRVSGAADVSEGSPKYRVRYTADEAAGHPVIRASVIVGHEVLRIKGSAPSAADLLTLANKALDVIDLLVPSGRPEAATDAWVERALIGLLTGALLAV